MKRILILLALLSLLPGAAALADGGFKFQKAGQELLLFGTTARVEPGEHYRKVIVFGGDLDFRGTTEEFLLFGGHVRFAPSAEVRKSMVMFGGTLDRDSGSKIVNDRVEFKTPSFLYRIFLSFLDIAGDIFQGTLRWIATFFFLLFAWLYALFLRVLSKRYFQEASGGIFSEFLRNAAWAVIGVLAFVPGILFLVLSVVGIALLPFYFLFYALSFFSAYVFLAVRLGGILRRKQQSSAGSILLGLVAQQLLFYFFPSLYLLVFLAWGSCLRSLRR